MPLVHDTPSRGGELRLVLDGGGGGVEASPALVPSPPRRGGGRRRNAAVGAAAGATARRGRRFRLRQEAAAGDAPIATRVPLLRREVEAAAELSRASGFLGVAP